MGTFTKEHNWIIVFFRMQPNDEFVKFNGQLTWLSLIGLRFVERYWMFQLMVTLGCFFGCYVIQEGFI